MTNEKPVPLDEFDETIKKVENSGSLSKYWKDYLESLHVEVNEKETEEIVAASIGIGKSAEYSEWIGNLFEKLNRGESIENEDGVVAGVVGFKLRKAFEEADKSIEENSVRGTPNYYCYGPDAKMAMEGEPYAGNIVTELRANVDGTVTVTETDITDGYQEVSTY
jgi:hypothetical protein